MTKCIESYLSFLKNTASLFYRDPLEPCGGGRYQTGDILLFKNKKIKKHPRSRYVTTMFWSRGVFVALLLTTATHSALLGEKRSAAEMEADDRPLEAEQILALSIADEAEENEGKPSTKSSSLPEFKYVCVYV